MITMLLFVRTGSNSMNKTIIIILVVLLVLGGGYYFATNSSPSSSNSSLTTTGVVSPNGTPSASFDFARALLNITTIKLDVASLEQDPGWTALRDFSVSLRAPVKGRRNPFAPLGVDSSAAVVSTTLTTPQVGSSTPVVPGTQVR